MPGQGRKSQLITHPGICVNPVKIVEHHVVVKRHTTARREFESLCRTYRSYDGVGRCHSGNYILYNSLYESIRHTRYSKLSRPFLLMKVWSEYKLCS
uniref:Uncharacterized protein n=2 Tax=Timema TaxID=61471 RepID=A0A7R9ICZ5_9NEOP|nr:unnamed protein product [Timema bartmani]CAD7454620.1 unnamed protein product [Timema tahoe]